MTGEPIKVVVVDDQPLLVSAFSALIGNQPDMTVVATAADGVEAVERTLAHAVDVVLMDIRMPRLDGVEATRRILAREKAPRVLVLTTFNVDELVLAAVGAGARGFLLKDAEPTEVIDAIRAVHRGEAVIASQAAPALLAAVRNPAALVEPTGDEEDGAAGPSPLVDHLTAREVEVLRLIAQGRTNAEIADDLFIAQTTVKTHVGNLLLKLDARDRVALVVLAHSVGLAGPAGTVPLS
ncbi:response regulator [Mobilicoccus caccae]|uniref:DNA-binding response regulator n=1 Tax=Mobilicoccus caccae TaxID=1859295 RepID=A0ABQ6IWP3_9MICO|nr:response regulator transcription factor [Mobilicoccus caccae]GMA37989.1 DNA-binding response regulator [Mobilicoccus caccae]GMA42372.1 DNA-binding response regulator [Mobilicoccus caccae]GMA42521.1 DNA-binding response regulator [Mobilicoccus caccae]